MKKLLLGILIIILVCPLAGNYRKKTAFLATAVNVSASATAENGAGNQFLSREIRVSNPGDPSIGSITVTFTRAAGTTSTLDFEFQASFDGGTTWTTAFYVDVQVPTNETASSNVVRVLTLINFHGVSHVRLYRIVNNDSSNNVTVCNATLTL